MVKTIELSTASQPLADYAEDFRDKTVVFTLNGKAFAAIVSLKELDLESLLVWLSIIVDESMIFLI